MKPRTSLVVVAAVAVASTTAGYAAASRIHSPAERLADATPPPAGPVTVPVERRRLASQVVVRGDVVFDDALDVAVDTSALAGPPIVTATPVAAGDVIDEGAVLCEIGGRPVVVLAGDLPAYRDLTPGLSGPDVAQLESALARLGHDPGTIDDAYDADTSAAVAALFSALGHEPPPPSVEAAGRADAAREALVAANAAVDAANLALDEARRGPTASERLAADAAVNDAQRALDQAHAAGDGAAAASAAERLAIAKAQRSELLAGPDVGPLEAELASATAERDWAQLQLVDATVAAATPMPAAEVAFVPSLPRRVGDVRAERGRPLDGPVASLTGVDLIVRAALGSADRALLSLGMAAEIDGGGVTAPVTLTELDDDTTTGSSTGTLVLDAPDPDTVAALAGLNVKVTIPIETTDGEVLVVPLAALTAGGDGTARVEVVDADGTRRLVPVEVGLVSGGYAEVRPARGQSLEVGDPVVVGT